MCSPPLQILNMPFSTTSLHQSFAGTDEKRWQQQSAVVGTEQELGKSVIVLGIHRRLCLTVPVFFLLLLRIFISLAKYIKLFLWSHGLHWLVAEQR